MSSQSALHTSLLIDAHVHIHDCFELQSFLDAAYKNFDCQAQQLKQNTVWVLLLTEISGVHAFDDIAQQRESLNQQLSGWRIEPTGESTSLRLVHQSGQILYIMSGRQIITQGKIEVLALITQNTVEDGLPLGDTLAKVEASQALCVLPWGVGKWIGNRGDRVQKQIETTNTPLFVGDNGNRPIFWALPDFCQQCPILPGTDPLPLPNEQNRVGSFGLYAQTELDSGRPGESLKQFLLAPETTTTAYGKLQSPLSFLSNQIQLRLNSSDSSTRFQLFSDNPKPP